MHPATVLMLWITAAGIAGAQLAAPPAQSLPSAGSREILARFVGPGSQACAVAFALPHELTSLIGPKDEAGCGPGIVSVPSPLSLADISARAMGHVWQTTSMDPNVRIERLARAARAWRDVVREGLEAATGMESAQDEARGQVEQALETR